MIRQLTKAWMKVERMARRDFLTQSRQSWTMRRTNGWICDQKVDALTAKTQMMETKGLFRLTRRLLHCSKSCLLEEMKTEIKTAKASTPINTLVEDPAVAFAQTSVINQKFAEQNESDNSIPLKIAIGRNASKRLKTLMAEDKNKNLAILVSVESGGCHGFSYKLEMVDLFNDEYISKDLNDPKNSQISKDDILDCEEYSIFVRDGDCKVILPYSSLNILRESKIDYVKELIGTSFKVVDSPYTKSACGCGTSFDVDFEKLGKKI